MQITLKQHSVVSFRCPQGKLVKGDNLSTSLQNPCTCPLSHMKCTNLQDKGESIHYITLIGRTLKKNYSQSKLPEKLLLPVRSNTGVIITCTRPKKLIIPANYFAHLQYIAKPNQIFLPLFNMTSCTTKSRFRLLFSLQHNLPTSLTEPNINGKEQGFYRHLAKRKSIHKPMAVGLTFNAGTSYNLKSSVIVPTTTQIFPEKSPFAFIFLTWWKIRKKSTVYTISHYVQWSIREREKKELITI